MRDDTYTHLAAVDLAARRDASILAQVQRTLAEHADELGEEADVEEVLDLARRTLPRARASHAWWRHSLSVLGPAPGLHDHAVEVLGDVYSEGGPAEDLERRLRARDPDWAPPRPLDPSSVLPFADLRYELMFPLGLQLVWAPNGLHLRLYVTNLGPGPLADLQVEGTDAVGRLAFMPAADADPRRVPPGAHVGFGVQVVHGGQGELPLQVALTTDDGEIGSMQLSPMG